ncbi:hypothetical protein V6N13_025635 [Hibiscus sabdariffa]|uniref:Uncharacterized protein n=2 Tax=Hibiscus sabdariffa TaxID=183260 RepID=A0ABR2C9M4_9ROSI
MATTSLLPSHSPFEPLSLSIFNFTTKPALHYSSPEPILLQQLNLHPSTHQPSTLPLNQGVSKPSPAPSFLNHHHHCCHSPCKNLISNLSSLLKMSPSPSQHPSATSNLQ